MIEEILYSLKLKQAIQQDGTIKEADKVYLFELINKVRREVLENDYTH